jgi:hypothetical protein
MKPTVQEEIEDDLAAEEENKLINEVSLRVSSLTEWMSFMFMGYVGIQDMVGGALFWTLYGVSPIHGNTGKRTHRISMI